MIMLFFCQANKLIHSFKCLKGSELHCDYSYNLSLHVIFECYSIIGDDRILLRPLKNDFFIK